MHVLFFGGDDIAANIYYSRALAVNADRASAWSPPTLIGERAITPSFAGLAGDGNGKLIAVYSGDLAGNGLYALNSEDGGNTWSTPASIFLTFSDELWPAHLQMHVGQSVQLYAAWSVVNTAGHGVAAYLSSMKLSTGLWGKSVELDQPTGAFLGHPSVIEYNRELFALYLNGIPPSGTPPAIWFLRSSDGGQSWSEPIRPFPNHIGSNGRVSLVIDGSNVLHGFFGERVPQGFGLSDIHGMWHSIWQGNRWSEPEAVISGPSTPARFPGDARSFDPVEARAVVSQGNTLLVTWRTDPGLDKNGVWYSFTAVDAPEQPVIPLSVPATAPSSLATLSTTPESEIFTASPSLRTEEAPPSQANNPTLVFTLALVPVILLLVGLVLFQQFIRFRRR
jgi:hypothetical protein